MHLTRRNVVLLAIAAGPASCAWPTEPSIKAILAVEASTIVATREELGGDTFLSFSVPMTVYNSGKSAINPITCGASIEVLGSLGWSEAWRSTPICNLALTLPLAPGGTRELQIGVRALINSPSDFIQQWRAPAGAPLRVRIGVGANNRGSLLYSDTFTLSEGT